MGVSVLKSWKESRAVITTNLQDPRRRAPNTLPQAEPAGTPTVVARRSPAQGLPVPSLVARRQWGDTWMVTVRPSRARGVGCWEQK